jgi:hypothetical protein
MEKDELISRIKNEKSLTEFFGLKIEILRHLENPPESD